MKKATVSTVTTTCGAVELEHHRITGSSNAIHAELAEREVYLEEDELVRCDEALLTMVQHEDGLVYTTVMLLRGGAVVFSVCEKAGV